MRQVSRILLVLATLTAGALPVAAFDGPTQNQAGAAKAEAPDSKSKAVTQSEKLLERGIAAYEADKATQAIRAFTTAINSGSLASPQMARALYYRGLAYSKRGKSGQAISDLTSAVWIKDGLNQAEQQQALQARGAAYRAAGISDVPALDVAPSVASGAPASGGGDAWQTAMGGSPAGAGWSAPPSPPALAATPATQPAPSSSSSGGGITGFFSNLFGGGSSSSDATSSQDEAVTTSSIGNEATAVPATTSWSQTTQVAPAEPEQARVAAPPPAAAAPLPQQMQVAAVAPAPSSQPSAPAGAYHIQVASLRSRNDAYALSVRLLSQYGSQFGTRRPQVDEKVIGSMGTFYRVRVGPYASDDEPRALCSTLHANGLDCMIVTQ
jgi:tetratricopeptide (TPR) repeat protein